MRFTEILFPITTLRMEILSELYKSPLKLKTISEKIGKSIASTNNSIQKMKPLLSREEGVYSIDKEVEKFMENLMIRYILENRLGKIFDFLSYIKKHIELKELIFFGSYYKKTNTEGSDLDLYIIANTDKESIDRLKNMFFNLYKIELDIKVVSPEIHMTKKDNLSNLYENISNDKTQGIKVPLKLI